MRPMYNLLGSSPIKPARGSTVESVVETQQNHQSIFEIKSFLASIYFINIHHIFNFTCIKELPTNIDYVVNFGKFP